MRTALLATFAVVLLAMSCSYCATRPVAYSDIHPHLGGPRYRVFDVDEIDSVDEAPPLESLFRAAEACIGERGSFAPVRVFAVSKIEVKMEGTGNWISSPVGVWATGTPWIYIKTGRTPERTAMTIIHEYVHYIKKMGHPKVDSLMKACNNYLQSKDGE